LEGVNALTKAARSTNVASKPSDASSGSGSGSGNGCGSGSSSSSSTNVAGSGSTATAMATPCGTPNHEWLLDCEEMSNDVLELSSPAVPQEDAESDTFSEPFWQDVDGEITN